MSEAFKYDVFISHSANDKAAVRELVQRLDADHLKVWFDEWIIKPGDSIPAKIEEGLEQSRTLVFVMSANSFASDWVWMENLTARFRDPTNTQRRFIPLRLDNAEIKVSLRRFAYIDWRQKSEDEYARLLAACRTALPDTVIGAKGKQSVVRTLTGHKERVNSVLLISHDQQIVSGGSDGTVRFWDSASGSCLATVKRASAILSIALAADGERIIVGSEDGTIRVLQGERRKTLLILHGHSDVVDSVAVTHDGRHIVSGSADKTIRLWDLESGRCLRVFEGHTGRVNCVAVMPDSRSFVSASDDKTLLIWNLASGELLNTLRGHTDSVQSVAVSSDGWRLVSGSCDQTVRVWDVENGACLITLKGHSDHVLAVAADTQLAVSGSRDRTIRVWDMTSGRCNFTFRGHTRAVTSIALSTDRQLIVSGSSDRTVCVWAVPATGIDLEPAVYTNAKVLLVGDTGVGKSGLAHRLVENRFQNTLSTHGTWVSTLKLASGQGTNDNLEREVLLWDLGGQFEYRLIHQLFMDETALVLLVFDPQTENLFEVLAQWDQTLEKAARRPFQKFLVAARCDRGGIIVAQSRIQQFMQERRYSRYFETSASTGAGCEQLRNAILQHIPWDQLPWTTSPRIFKLLKDEIIGLRDEGRALLRLSELSQQLEMRLPAENFTLEQLHSVVGLLAGHGLVWQVEFGDFVLLQPQFLNSYAAALIRTVRRQPDELGSIAEEEVLMGNLWYSTADQRLPRNEEQIVLRAMHKIFVDHRLCFREHTQAGTQLVFPSYFRRERPQSDAAAIPYITYQFSGPLDEIYSTLVVRLHHSVTFQTDRLWRDDVDFKTATDKRIGLRLTKKPDGIGELGISFEKDIPDETRLLFVRYVHDHLNERAREVVRLRHYVCRNCDTSVDPKHVQVRLSRGAQHIVCPVCEKQISLIDLIEERFVSDNVSKRVREMDELSRINLDNESRELILVGHAYSVAVEAGHIFRPTPGVDDIGVDGEIEFKDDKGQASGRRIYLQFKSADHYLRALKADGTEVYTVKNPRHAEYWQAETNPVMLVIRDSSGQIRWMNVTEYFQQHGRGTDQLTFHGETFNALNLIRMRERLASRGSVRANELAKLGRRHLEAGRLDNAVGQFAEFLKLGRPASSDKEWQSVRSGLLEVARRSIEDSPGRMNLALATLIREAPDWLARRLCRGLKLRNASLDAALSVELETPLMPVTLIGADSNGFGWEIQLIPVDDSEAGAQPLSLSINAKNTGNNVVLLSAETPDLPTALYLLTVRFREGERIHWQADISLSRGEFKNPYIAGPPVRRPEFFFGRDSLLKDVRLWLEDYSVVLLGPRRSGKTSFLYQLARLSRPNEVTVNVDLHAFAGSSTKSLAADLKREILRTCVGSPVGRVPSDLRGLQRRLQEAKVERLLILMDEMAVLAKHPPVALQLRAMSKWQQPTTSLIVAGTISDEQKVSAAALDIGSPPFNEFRVCRLEEISAQHAQELLEKPVRGYFRYEKPAIKMLLTLAGGQPFFLNILAQLVFKFVQNERVHTIRASHVEKAREEAVHELGRWFQEFVVELAPATRRALPKIVRNGKDSLPAIHAESLQNAGLTVGPRSELRLNPLFVDWWNSNLREKG